MTGSGSPPGAVVIGAHANGLGAVRSLGRAGLPVAVVRTRQQDLAHLSRHATEHHFLEDFYARPESLVELLEREASRWRGRTLLPTNDHALSVLSRCRDRILPHYPDSIPPFEVVEQLLDKSITHRIAREEGLDVPRRYGAATSENARRADVDFPVLVKPRRGHLFFERFGQKLFVCRTEGELRDAVARVERSGIDADIVDLVPGEDGRIYQVAVYVDRRGEPRASGCFRKLRQAPTGFGVTRAARLVARPELMEPVVAVLRRMEWRGIAAAEFKHDPRDSTFRLMEINGRCVLPHGLLRAGGVDLPLLHWREFTGDGVSGSSTASWPGTWIHLHDDVLQTARETLGGRGSLAEVMASYRGPTTYAVWDPRDVGPFLRQWRNMASNALRVASEKLRGKVRETGSRS